MEKILEDPLIEVIELESKPPVQDSAKEIFNFFLTNNLIIFFIFIFTQIYNTEIKLLKHLMLVNWKKKIQWSWLGMYIRL